MKRTFLFLGLLLAALVATQTLVPAGPNETAAVERGRYLVHAMGCSDCHTPHVLGPNGVELDHARAYAGHPAELALPPAPELPPGPWVGTFTGTMTAWSGPWGTSFPANLTPDPETGLGRWTAEDFLATVRSGRHLGRGRPILPPMPINMLQALTDDDVRAVFAFLQSLPPIRNRVPDPIAPPGAR